MNWEVAASISEVVSGAAVVASLLMLGRDLRQNTRAMKAANYIKVNDTMIENTCVMMGSEAGGPIFLKAMNGLSNLEFQDYYQFHLVMLGLLRRYETLFVQESLNLIDGWSTEGFKTSLMQLLTHKGVQEWWPGSACLYSRKFAEYVTSLMEAGGESGKRGHGHIDWDESVDARYTASSGRQKKMSREQEPPRSVTAPREWPKQQNKQQKQ